MKMGYMIPVHKKWDKRKCGNYRGICVTKSFINIMENIIINETERDYHTTEEQSEVTKGFSTTEHIFPVRQVLGKFSTKNRTLV
jgi:hypothetical protein